MANAGIGRVRRIHRRLGVEELEARVAPSTINLVDLQPGSDSGTSNVDNITNVTQPSIDINVTYAAGVGTIDVDWNGDGIADPEDLVGLAIDSDVTLAVQPALVLGDGTYIPLITLYSGDGDSPQTDSSLTFTIDTSAPAAPSTPDMTGATDSGVSDEDNITNNTTPDFTGTSEPDATVNLYSSVAGLIGTGTADALGNWTITVALLSEGDHDITAQATDVAGNPGSVSAPLTITIDTTPPDAPGGAPDLQSASDKGAYDDDNITNDTTPTFDAVGEDPYIRIYRDGVALASDPWATTPVTLDVQPFGTFTYTSRAVDAAGNPSGDSPGLSVTISNSIDMQPGSDSGVSDEDDITNVTQPWFDITVTFGVGPGTIDVDWNGDGFVDPEDLAGVAIGSGVPLAVQPAGALADGTYTPIVTVHSGDPDQLISPMTFIIDTSLPAAPSIPDLTSATDSGVSDVDNITNNTTPDFTGTSEPNATVNLYSSVDGLIGTGTADDLGNWTITTALSSEGDHDITAEMTDPAGNTGPLSAPLTITLDTTPPPAPGAAPDLQSASDTGAYDDDNITSDTTPTFDVVDADPYIRIYGNGVLASDPFAAPPVTLDVQSFDTFTYTARAVDVAGNESGDSPGLSVIIFDQTTAPDITVTDSIAPSDDLSMPFGNVIADGTGGVTVTATFTIRNDGFADLNVTSVALGGGTDFSLTDVPASPFVVAAGDSIMITVLFDPTAAGPQTDTITILSDDIDEGTLTMDLTGTGIEGTPLVLDADNPVHTFTDGDGDLLRLTFAGPGQALIYDASGAAPDGTDIAFVSFAGTTTLTSLTVTDMDQAGGTLNTLTAGTVTTEGTSVGALRFINSCGWLQNTTLTINGDLGLFYVLASSDTLSLQVNGSLKTGTFVGPMDTCTVTVTGLTTLMSGQKGQTDSVFNLNGGSNRLLLAGGMNNVTVNVTGNAGDLIFQGGMTGSAVDVTGNVGRFVSAGFIAGGSSVHIQGSTGVFRVSRGIVGNSTVDLDGDVRKLYVLGRFSGVSVEAGSRLTLGQKLTGSSWISGTIAGTVDITGSSRGTTSLLLGGVSGSLLSGAFGNVLILGSFTGAIGDGGTAAGIGNMLLVTNRRGAGVVTPANAFARYIGYRP